MRYCCNILFYEVEKNSAKRNMLKVSTITVYFMFVYYLSAESFCFSSQKIKKRAKKCQIMHFLGVPKCQKSQVLQQVFLLFIRLQARQSTFSSSEIGLNERDRYLQNWGNILVITLIVCPCAHKHAHMLVLESLN